MAQKINLHPVCVTAQFPGELANFLTKHAASRGMTVSALLRGLVIDLKDRWNEARSPIMEEADAIPETRALVKVARRARKGGGL